MTTRASASHLGPFDSAAFDILRGMDPAWAEHCRDMAANPWTGAVLPERLVELISVGIQCACTNLDREGTRRHMRAALRAGATAEEILLVVKCATVMAIHSCSLGAPILLEETGNRGGTSKAGAEAGIDAGAKAAPVPTPACDAMKAMGQWNTAWDPFLGMDPQWTDQFMATGAGIYGSHILTPKELELLSVALDASFTHMYSPGVRRHIRNAMAAGATPREVMEVLKLCVSHGVQACNLALPILAEELAARGGAR